MTTSVPYKYYAHDGIVEMLPGYNTPFGASEVSQQDFVNFYNQPGNKARLDSYYSNNSTPGLKEAFQAAISGGNQAPAGYSSGGNFYSSAAALPENQTPEQLAYNAQVKAATQSGQPLQYVAPGVANPGASSVVQPTKPLASVSGGSVPNPTDYRIDPNGNITTASGQYVTASQGQALFAAGLNATQIPKTTSVYSGAGATQGGQNGSVSASGTTTVPAGSISSQLGKQFTRVGQDVYYVNPDGTLGAKMTADEFNSTWKSQGLNLEIIPQSTGGTSQPTSITGNSQLDAYLKQLQDQLDTITSQGKQLNPAIELDPSTVQKFLDQATSELSPYYQSQYAIIKDGLSKNLQDLQAHYDNTKEQENTAFRQSLDQTREGYADKGLAFSGVRNQGEQDMGNSENLKLADLGQQYSSQAGQLARSAEQQVGSRNLAGLSTPSFTLSSVDVTNPGKVSLQTSRDLPFWSPSGVTGSLEREQTTAVATRQNELENAARTKLGLDYYQT